MKKIKVILFDAYGTFLSTGTGSVDAAAKILAKNGSSADPAEFYARWKQLHRQAARSSTFLPERDIFADSLRRLYDEYSIDGDHMADVGIMLDSLLCRRAFPEVSGVLPRLAERYRLFVASNTDTAPLMQNLEYNSIGSCFEGIFTSEALGCYKPSPEFYRDILGRIGCAPEEAVFVGDSPEEDVIAPARLGMVTVLVDRRAAGPDCGQTFTVSGLDMFAGLLL